jgi:hypothetical protein
MADAIAGQSHLESTAGLMVYHFFSEDVHAALVPPGTWHWRPVSRLSCTAGSTYPLHSIHPKARHETNLRKRINEVDAI